MNDGIFTWLCDSAQSVLVSGPLSDFPYVSFMGQTLANHSYVDLSLVGSAPDGSDSVLCHTDLSTCCSGFLGPHRGDWHFPDGTRLPFIGPDVPIGEGRGAQRVDLCRTTATGPTGIYRCDISTDNVHDNTDISVRDTVYVGLYVGSGGRYTPLVEIAVVMSVFGVKCL